MKTFIQLDPELHSEPPMDNFTVQIFFSLIYWRQRQQLLNTLHRYPPIIPETLFKFQFNSEIVFSDIALDQFIVKTYVIKPLKVGPM